MKQKEIKEYYEKQLKEQKELLAKRCDTLSKRMKNIADNIECSTINACGEIQDRRTSN